FCRKADRGQLSHGVVRTARGAHSCIGSRSSKRSRGRAGPVMTRLRLGHCGEPTRDQIGGKAFSINAMLRLGLPVPPAFVFDTEECTHYYRSGQTLSEQLRSGLRAGIATLEDELGRQFGSADAPLLVSVRSGAARSMPGMMDTVLNLGINDPVADALRS